MDTEHLGLSPDQQAQIDDIFVDTTLQVLANMTKYWDRARLTQQGGLAEELEAIHSRTYNRAHSDVIEEREIPPIINSLLGKLAFIDTLALPSSQTVGKKDPVKRALGDYQSHRRLFSGLPHTSSSTD